MLMGVVGSISALCGLHDDLIDPLVGIRNTHLEGLGAKSLDSALLVKNTLELFKKDITVKILLLNEFGSTAVDKGWQSLRISFSEPGRWQSP